MKLANSLNPNNISIQMKLKLFPSQTKVGGNFKWLLLSVNLHKLASFCCVFTPEGLLFIAQLFYLIKFLKVILWNNFRHLDFSEIYDTIWEKMFKLSGIDLFVKTLKLWNLSILLVIINRELCSVASWISIELYSDATKTCQASQVVIIKDVGRQINNSDISNCSSAGEQLNYLRDGRKTFTSCCDGSIQAIKSLQNVEVLMKFDVLILEFFAG